MKKRKAPVLAMSLLVILMGGLVLYPAIMNRLNKAQHDQEVSENTPTPIKRLNDNTTKQAVTTAEKVQRALGKKALATPPQQNAPSGPPSILMPQAAKPKPGTADTTHSGQLWYR